MCRRDGGKRSIARYPSIISSTGVVGDGIRGTDKWRTPYGISPYPRAMEEKTRRDIMMAGTPPPPPPAACRQLNTRSHRVRRSIGMPYDIVFYAVILIIIIYQVIKLRRVSLKCC